MSTIYYKGLYQVEVLGFVIVHVRSTASCYNYVGASCYNYVGASCYNYVGASCYNYVGASCYNCNNARTARTDGSASELCADND